MMTCIFCDIVAGTANCECHYEDDQIMAFSDIAPKAPIHLLIIPKRHIATLNDVTTAEVPLLGHLLDRGQQLAKQFKIAESGYRLVFNTNADGGQVVFHIHCHLLGGHPMCQLPG